MLAVLIAALMGCPRMLEVDPKEWKEALLKAAPGSKEQGQLLEQLGFRPVPPAGDAAPDAECAEQPVVRGVDLVRASVTGGKDLLVHVRLELCADEGESHFWSQRIAVLKALRGGAYCKLGGEDPSMDAPASDVCGGPDRPPRSVKLVRLTSGRRDTLELDDRLDECPGSVHTVVERTSFLDAHGDQLAKVFELKTRETSSEVPEEPAPVIERTVKPIGRGFPRKLLVTEEVSCPEGNPGGACTPDRRKAVHVLTGGKYVAR
ncbi:MAG TPA: hypothetical protein VF994_16240 [Myxococcales bacterium]